MCSGTRTHTRTHFTHAHALHTHVYTPHTCSSGACTIQESSAGQETVPLNASAGLRTTQKPKQQQVMYSSHSNALCCPNTVLSHGFIPQIWNVTEDHRTALVCHASLCLFTQTLSSTQPMTLSDTAGEPTRAFCGRLSMSPGRAQPSPLLWKLLWVCLRPHHTPQVKRRQKTR